MKNRNKLILVAVLSFILLFLVVLVKVNLINNIDSYMYGLISKMLNENVTLFFKYITFLGSSYFIILMVLFLLIIYRKSRRGVEIASIVIISTLINNIFKMIIQRPRPNILPLVIEKSYSFPSGHTMAITTLVGILVYQLWKRDNILAKNSKILITSIFSIIVVLVMISRIYLGVHYFSDVLGGFITSIIILLLFTTFLSPKLK